MRLYSTWSENIAANIALALMLLFGVPNIATGQTTTQQPTANEIGAALGNEALSKWGSQAGVMNNFTTPLTGGGTMTTLHNSPFEVQSLSCPASKMFMRVTILPTNTGDLSPVIVEQDTNLDGSIDYTYQAPILASGICANGIINCDAGTWNNCKYYKWTAQGGKVTLAQAASILELAGCYCINNSCGTNLAATRLNIILSDLGSGAVGAVQGSNPQYAVSNATVTDTTITYYGQQSTACSMGNLGVQVGGSQNPSQYAQNPGWYNIDDDAQQMVAMLSSDPNSLYSTLMATSEATQKQVEYKPCTIRRTASVNAQTVAPVREWKPWLFVRMECDWGRDSVNSCRIDIDRDTNNDGIYDVTDRVTYGQGWMVCRGDGGIPVHLDRTMQVINEYLRTYSVPSTDFRRQDNYEHFEYIDGGGKGCHANISRYYTKWEKLTPPLCPQGYQYYSTDNNCYLETLAEGIVDGCANITSDQNCRLKSEKVDGVTTYTNYMPTGLTPLPSCKDVSGVFLHTSVCKDWWLKERTYMCETASQYNFSDVRERVAAITSSVEQQGASVIGGAGAITYTDKRKVDGAWQTETNSIKLSAYSSGDDCQKTCKIRRPTVNTQASHYGNASQYQVNTQSYDIVYAVCPTATNTCPTQAGDIIEKNCQCVNEFAEAATLVSIVNTAGKDMICSSGVPRP